MKEVIIYSGAFLIFVLLVWFTWQRPNRKRLLLRILAILGIILSLVFLFIPPQQTIKLSSPEVLLLTPGYHADSVQRVLKTIKNKTAIISYGGTAGAYKSIFSITELVKNFPQISRLHVFGYGLDEAELKHLPSLPIIPHLSSNPTGIVSLDWLKNITVGQKFRVSGRYYQDQGTVTWLYLQVAGKTQDSLQIKKDRYTRFNLSYVPKQVGQYVYALYTKNKNTLTFVGELPIIVKPKLSLRMLLLPAAPSFEFKFLKNYLAAEQHQVAQRIPISKNIYQSEWLNMPQVPIHNITSGLLQQFDVLITNKSTIANLPVQEQQALRSAIRQNGLGLLLITDLVTGVTPAWLNAFQFVRTSGQDTPSATSFIRWPGQDKALTIHKPLITLKPTAALKNLVRDAAGNTLVATHRQGWGKITVSVLPQTFTWLLKGNKEGYADFWSWLFSQTSKPIFSDHTWQVATKTIPLVNQSSTLMLADYNYKADKNIPQAIIKANNQPDDSVYMAQDSRLPHRFTGMFWPRQTGWHQVHKTGGSPQFFYVFTDSSYVAYRNYERLITTRHYIENKSETLDTNRLFTTKQPVSPNYFFLLFVACTGFIWLEEKL